MKSKLKIFLLSIVLIIFGFKITICNAQSRTESKELIITKKSDTLKTAIGWAYNETLGKWASNKNAISAEPISQYMYGQTTNFKQISIISFDENNQKYYVLIWEETSGYYEYPEIYSDWHNCKKTNFIVFDTIQYNSLLKIKDNLNHNIVIKSKLYGNMDNRFTILGGSYKYDKKTLLAKIQATISETSYSNKCIVFNCQNDDKNNLVVRFTSILDFSSSENQVNWDGKSSTGEYFETDFKTFSKLLK